jgi:phage terminase large subunit
MSEAAARPDMVLPSLEPVGFLGRHGAEEEAALRVLEKRRRALVLYEADRDPVYRAALREKARRSVRFFFEQFVFTFDPRRMQHFPMVLWPRQAEYLEALELLAGGGGDLVVEKSRDCGVTYLNIGFAVHRWLFVPGFTSGFCANLAGLVDQLDDPDTILEKGRMILRRLPWWLKPAGMDVAKDCLVGRFINRANGNVIVGEGGTEAGRGGRTTIYFIDEAAHIDKADRVNNATAATSRARLWCSSVNGPGNFFAQHRRSGRVPVFVFDWRDDPRKDEAWAEAKRREIGAVAFAQEYGRDYGASTERVIIPGAWVEASRALRRHFEAQGVLPHERPVVGADVGKGIAENVLIARRGPWVDRPECWVDANTAATAYRALDYCFRVGALALHYDSVGVGEGLTATFSLSEEARRVEIAGVATGRPASDALWPDSKTGREKFANIKAELWWRCRERLQRTFSHWRWLKGLGEGEEQSMDAILLLPDDDVLGTQLSTPMWFDAEGRKVMVETKMQLRSRGVPSPDRADALMLTLWESNLQRLWVGEL